jgi:hypothetical protein
MKTMIQFVVRRGSLSVLTVALLAAFVMFSRPSAQGPAPAAAVIRNDIAGDWLSTNNEDIPHRNPGPELGDYTGLPVNAAERQKADSWDASILSQPERQAQSHPAQYFMRGPRPDLRVLKILDPVTQTLVAYAMAGVYGRADRIIWMDGRPHPSDYSEHTWDGFATGVWENGQLVVTTTHMKQGVYQRNGVAASQYAKMVEHYFRHGLYMSSFFTVDDPIFLEEPLARTQTWTWDPNATIEFGNPFMPVDELGDRPLGWVPHWALGTRPTEFGEMHSIPYEATRGGMETTYPEYQLKLAEMMKRDEAAKDAAARKEAAAKPAAKK